MPKRGGFAAVAMALAAVLWTGKGALAADTDAAENLWPLARAIQDFVDSPPLTAPSAFAQDGWNRIADRLSALTDADLATAKSDPGAFIRMLLAGKDRDAYCAQLDGLTSGGHISVPIELMQARDVGVALAPYLANLTDFASSHPGAEQLRQAVMAKIDAIVVNDRLATEIERFAEPLSSGLLALPRPPLWPTGDAWPPTPQRLSALADTLRHVVGDKPIVCSDAKLPGPAAGAINEARKLAQIIADEVAVWARQYASLPDLMVKDAPTAPKVPAQKTVSILPVAASSTEWVPHVALIPSADDPRLYTVALEAVIGGHTVQWPAGITVDEVHPDTAGRLFFVPRSLVPNVSTVDGAALNAALGQIGLPRAIRLGDQGKAIISPNFESIEASMPIAVGSIYQGGLHIRLVKDGKSEVFSSLKKEIARIRGEITARLKASPPPLRLAGETVAIDGVQVAVAGSLTEATVEGALHLRLGATVPALLQDDLRPSVKLAVPFDGSAIRLVDARWPDAVMDELKKLLGQRLPSANIGLGQCVGFAGLALTLDGKANLGLAATLIADGKPTSPFSVDMSSAFEDIASRFVALAGDGAVLQCLARQLLDPGALKALEDLKNTKVSIAGIAFAVTKPEIFRSDGKVRFKANLISVDDPDLAITDIVVNSGWTSGQPLAISAIDVDGAKLSQGFAERLLNKIAPGASDWVSIRGLTFGHGVMTIDGTVSIPGILSNPVSFKNIGLDLSQAGKDARKAIIGLALSAIATSTGQLKDRMASLGVVKDVNLDTTRTNLDDPKNPQIWFRVTLAAEGLDGVTIPLLVELPQFKIEPDGNISETLIGAVLGPLTKALGGVAAGSGVSNVRALADAGARRYGAVFDAGVKVAGIVSVNVRDVVFDQHGLSLPENLGIEIPTSPTPIPPLPLQLSRLGGIIWLHPAGKFGANAEVTLTADDTGQLLRLDAEVEGDPKTQRLAVDGSLYVLSTPMFRSEGAMDFHQGTASVDVKTLKPLSSILNIHGHATVTRGDVAADASLDLLGLKQTGSLDIDLRGGRVIMVGKAAFTDLGEASVSLTTNKNFRNPTAQGSVGIDFIGAKADMGLGVSYASLDFHWHSIGLKVVAPSVGRINSDLIRHIIESLFDFRIDFKHLDHITINLVDKNGKATDASYGGGDAPADSQDSGAAETPDPKTSDARPLDGADSGGKGDSGNAGAAAGRCSNEQKNSGRKHIWATDPQLGANIFIEADDDGKTHWISTDARIIDKIARDALEKGTEIDCIIRSKPTHGPLKMHFSNGDFEIQSTAVAVFISAGNPGKLYALEFYKGAVPVEIALPGNTAAAFFGNAGLGGASQWKPTRSQHRLLTRVVNDQLDKATIRNVTAIPVIDIVPEWKSSGASLIEETVGGRNLAVLQNEAGGFVEIPEGSPLYSFLVADPAGPFASLVASVPRLSSLTGMSGVPLVVRAEADSSCFLVLADAGSQARQYAIAIAKKAYDAVHLIDAQTRMLADRGWLDPHCARFVALGSRAELYAASSGRSGDGAVSETLIAARAEGASGKPATWWLSDTTMQIGAGPAKPVQQICASEPDFVRETPSSAVRNKAVLDLSSGDRRRVGAMLRDLADPNSWPGDFYVNPRGFLQAAAGSVQCPNVGEH